eukprot:CAMPEP_0180329390 /NCGR_PEP_ID=MMETSP0988-20121125/40753_1 /TAXON_ID=697907 /ORGANISM="non described non described, Strain CCMP2293" /LENGTH=189 /DNA_ID=CAMNT_0022316525 /DNA_START=196 /DNA_END=761 /DNA_ORIENTATION=+
MRRRNAVCRRLPPWQQPVREKHRRRDLCFDADAAELRASDGVQRREMVPSLLLPPCARRGPSPVALSVVFEELEVRVDVAVPDHDVVLREQRLEPRLVPARADEALADPSPRVVVPLPGERLFNLPLRVVEPRALLNLPLAHARIERHLPSVRDTQLRCGRVRVDASGDMGDPAVAGAVPVLCLLPSAA